MHRIVLVGFGNVARAYARLLVERRRDLARTYGLEAKVVGIVTRRRGSVRSASGIDLRRALAAVERGATLEGLGTPIRGTAREFLAGARADVVVELTPLVIAPRQPAVDHVVAAIQGGKHVITANKGPVVYHYRRLRGLAVRQGVGFRYEGTVMDGAPVFNLFQETMRGARLESFEGILNSVSNFVLGTIESGGTFADGVEAARGMGLLEADPTMDLEGWDAAVKACLLGNVLMGGRLRPEGVAREGIAGIEPGRVRAASAAGRRLKQVARGERGGGRVRVSVSLEELGADHPLAHVDGTSNALLARTDMIPELLISERNPGVRQTAFAVYGDLLAIHEGRLTP
jgi:homoserine dehydrogenase